MIYYLLRRRTSYTLNVHLETWGRILRPRLRLLYYEQLALERSLQPGTYIFSDLELLNEPQLDLARAVAGALQSAGAAARVLNDPAKVLGREALLRELHRRGDNPFAVYRVGDDLSGVRFPVFVRRANEHDGSQSDLLHTRQELDAAVAQATEKGYTPADLLIIEHCNTADAAGVYRKYSVHRIADHFMARHMHASREWVVKYADVVDEPYRSQETAYIESNPHREQTARIFALANIDYGRIDYSLLGDRIVTWEINTNPVVGLDPEEIYLVRIAEQARCVREYNRAMEAIDVIPAGPSIPLKIPASVRRRAGALEASGRPRRGLLLRRLSQRWPWNQMLRAAPTERPYLSE